MDLFGAGVNGPLIVARAIHFAATAITAGSLVFGAVVARPALGSGEAEARLLRRQTLVVAWIGLAIAAASGVIWFLLQAAAMSGTPARRSHGIGRADDGAQSDPIRTGLRNPHCAGADAGRLSGLRPVCIGELAGARRGLRLDRCHRLDRPRRLNARGDGKPAFGRRRVASTGRGRLDRRPGIVRPSARDGSTQPGGRMGVACSGRGKEVFDAGHHQRGDSVGDRHGQRMDSRRLVSRAGCHRIWAAP